MKKSLKQKHSQSKRVADSDETGSQNSYASDPFFRWLVKADGEKGWPISDPDELLTAFANVAPSRRWKHDLVDGVHVSRYPTIDFWTEIEWTNLRDQLRRLWRGDVKNEEKQQIVQAWISYEGERPHINQGPTTSWIVWSSRQLLLNPRGIRTLLAYLVIVNASRLVICENPDCKAPYFLTNRKKQKFCERKECRVYAQRQHALSWWKKEGKERRQRSQAKPRPPTGRKKPKSS